MAIYAFNSFKPVITFKCSIAGRRSSAISEQFNTTFHILALQRENFC